MRVVFGVLLCMVLSALGATAQQISLHGTHAVTVAEDDPGFADPDYDDSHWPRIPLPGSLRAAGLDGRADVFWYRIAFELPAGWAVTQPAMRLGIISRADETYLNGVRIGGLGQVGGRLTDWHAYAPTLPRLYAFDPALLRPGEVNVLAIRGAREPYIDDGGVVSGPVAIVPLAEALDPFLALQTRFAGMQYLFFGLETMILLALLIGLWLGLTGAHLRLFMLFYLPAYGFSFERRGIAALLGLDGPAMQYISNLAGALSFPALITLVAFILQRPVGAVGRTLQIVSVLALITPPNPARPALQAWTIDAHLVWHLVMLCGLLMLAGWSVRAMQRHIPYARPLCVGFVILFSSIFVDILLPANQLERTLGIRLGEVGILVFYMTLALVMIRIVADREQRLRAANLHIKVTHEAERARMARDLHDGIGQWLAAIKIRLDLLRQRGAHPGALDDGLEMATADIETAIDDVRRVSHDLAPSLLDERGLVGAMRAYAERLSGTGPIRIVLHDHDSPELNQKTATEVFRIFQEALSNAVRHSGCRRIDVTLAPSASAFHMTIADDGSGFDPEQQAEAFSLGITSMHSRARLLGADLTLVSAQGSGTVLTFALGLRATRDVTA